MTYAAVAVGGAAVIGGGMATQGYFGNKSSKKAAKAQRNAMDSYLAQMRQGRDNALSHYKPYEEAGRSGLTLLQQYLTGDPMATQNRLEQSPGYQFRLNQGQNSIQNLLASKGGLKSGAAMKALEEYAQGTASQEFGNQVNYLQNLANMGQQSATGMANAELFAGSAMANASQQGILGQGITMANRDAQMGNIIGGGMSQIGGAMLGTALSGMSPKQNSNTYQPTGASTGAYDNTRLNVTYPSTLR